MLSSLREALDRRLQRILTTFRSERGANLVEYALLVALITVVALGAVTFFGTSATDLTSSVASELVTAQS